MARQSRYRLLMCGFVVAIIPGFFGAVCLVLTCAAGASFITNAAVARATTACCATLTAAVTGSTRHSGRHLEKMPGVLRNLKNQVSTLVPELRNRAAAVLRPAETRRRATSMNLRLAEPTSIVRCNLKESRCYVTVDHVGSTASQCLRSSL
jgi:hypothetical protein